MGGILDQGLGQRMTAKRKISDGKKLQWFSSMLQE